MDEVLDKLSHLIEEVERLLQTAVSAGGECADSASEQVRGAVSRMRGQISQLEHRMHRLRGDVGRSMSDADRYVREHPWRTAGIAAGAAFVLGLLLARRGD